MKEHIPTDTANGYPQSTEQALSAPILFEKESQEETSLSDISS